MRWSGLAAAVLLSGCFTYPDCAAPAGPAPIPSGPAERAALESTDALISAGLAEGLAPARLDAAARELGFSGGAELVALAGRDCLEDSDVERFAAARSLSPATAADYLRWRGVRVCAGR